MKATAFSGKTEGRLCEYALLVCKKTAEVFQAWAGPRTNGPLPKQPPSNQRRSTIPLFHCTHFSYEKHMSSEGKVAGEEKNGVKLNRVRKSFAIINGFHYTLGLNSRTTQTHSMCKKQLNVSKDLCQTNAALSSVTSVESARFTHW